MYQTTSKDEAIIRMVGKLSLEFPELDQLKVRNIIEESLYKYDVVPQETALVASDVEDKLQMYLAVKKLEGLSAQTLNNRQLDLLKLASFIKKPLATVTTTDLRMFLAVRCKNLKESTTNHHISVIKSFFKWLVEEGYIPMDPSGKIKKMKVPNRVRKPLTDKEVELLRLACVNIREKALIEFLSATGCRLSEVVKLNISDLSWAQRTFFVIGKGNKEREVNFNAKAEVALQNYLNTREDDCEALFVTMRKYNGKCRRLKNRGIEKEVQKIAVRAGINKSVFPHIFRHTFADSRLNSGTPLHIVQAMLGHANPATTQIYASTSRENVRHEYRRGA